MENKELKNLPYGRTSINEILNDHKGLLYKYALQHCQKWKSIKNINESLSDVYIIFLQTIYSFDESKSFHGNTKHGYYSYLNSQLEYQLKHTRTKYYKNNKQIPESNLTEEQYEKYKNTPDNEDTTDITAKNDIIKLLNSHILDNRESNILKYYYGIGTGNKQTLRDISKKIKISHELARKIIIKSENKLRKYLSKDIQLIKS